MKVTISGSIVFWDEMCAVAETLAAHGIQVSLPNKRKASAESRINSEEDLALVKKKLLDDHLAKIRQSDCVLVVNPEKNGIPGYIGASTLIELACGYVLGKKLFLLHAPSEQPCRAEVLGMHATVLNGKPLSAVKTMRQTARECQV
jgi:hypothetical protein